MKDFQLTRFLIADTPDELSALTAQMQVSLGMQLEFFDFSQTKQGKFICWFKVPYVLWLEKVSNGKT